MRYKQNILVICLWRISSIKIKIEKDIQKYLKTNKSLMYSSFTNIFSFSEIISWFSFDFKLLFIFLIPRNRCNETIFECCLLDIPNSIMQFVNKLYNLMTVAIVYKT